MCIVTFLYLVHKGAFSQHTWVPREPHLKIYMYQKNMSCEMSAPRPPGGFRSSMQPHSLHGARNEPANRPVHLMKTNIF